MNLGRLIRTTNEICSECGRGHLQIRGKQVNILVDGTEIQEEKKYLACNKCDHEESYVDKKEDKKNKHREVEVYEVKRNDNFNKERYSTKKRIK